MKPELIVALDVDNEKRARELVDMLVPAVKFFKVGSLFLSCGPAIVNYISEKGGQTFLDLKFYDIPQTVSNYAYTGTSTFDPYVRKQATPQGIFMMTVHARGGKEMLQAAVKGAKQRAEELKISRPFIVGVTVLTSETYAGVEKDVLERAKIAKDAGIDGVVCSVHEAAAVRREFIIVTPGIRPAGAKTDDQKRIATIDDARAAGADYIVVGRPVIEAVDPRKAAKQFLTD